MSACISCGEVTEHIDSDRYADYFKCPYCGKTFGIPHQ